MMRNFLAKIGLAKKVRSAAPAVPEQDAANAVAAQAGIDAAHRQRAAGDWQGAERSLLEAIALKHDCGEAHLALGELLLARGRHEDAVDACQLAVHFLPAQAMAQVMLAGALLALQRHDDAAAACRAALALDPALAAAWLCLGNVLKARDDLPAAVDAYRRAATAIPPDIHAMQQLAFVEFRLGRYDEARRDFATLLAAAPDSYRAHHNFGLLQLETGFAQDALDHFRRALELQADSVETQTCIGHALRDLDRIDEALAAYDAALAARPDFGDALSNRSLTLLLRGDFAAGWPQYEQRFAASGTRARSAGLPRWQGESLAGKTIVVHSEQGIGDEIMFASCLPDLIAGAGRVVIACEPRLRGLFERSFPQAIVRERDGGKDQSSNAGDCEIAIGSLPLHFRKTAESFRGAAGYLRADAARVAHWHNRYAAMAAQKKVGIAWRGGTLRNRGHLRSLALADAAPLLRQADCAFVSLQHGECGAELSEVGARAGITVLDAARETGADIDELAAAVAALDLVVTVDNTVAHLCGALGTPVWVLLPFSAEWRYGREKSAMPWYPSMRLFRQPRPQAWGDVLANVGQALQQLTGAEHVRSR